MALTISTHPAEVITNEPKFTVATSLTEGSSVQNLRVRATVYMGGVSSAVAVLEQPAGLNDWDLFELLKGLTGKCNSVVPSTTTHIQPTAGSELLTAWTNYYTSWTTWSTSGRTVTYASDSASPIGLSDSFSTLEEGDILIFGIEQGFIDSGDTPLYAGINIGGTQKEAKVQYAGLSDGKMQSNHIYFLMAHSSLAQTVSISSTGAVSISGLTASIHKISDFKGNPGVYFHVKFEDVYENASNATVISSESWSDTMLFVPVKVCPGESFSDYLSTETTTTKKFLTRAEDGDVLYKFDIGMEVRAMYLSTMPWLRSGVEFDASSYTVDNIPGTGWGMVVTLEATGGIAATDETIRLRMLALEESGGSLIATVIDMTIDCELKCYPDITCLSFVGDLGEETVLFKGLPSKNGVTSKTFMQTSQRIRKVLNSYSMISHTLRTIYETAGVRSLLHELINTQKDVWLFSEDYDDNYTEVTVITDETPLVDQDELIESEIEIEYYE